MFVEVLSMQSNGNKLDDCLAFRRIPPVLFQKT